MMTIRLDGQSIKEFMHAGADVTILTETEALQLEDMGVVLTTDDHAFFNGITHDKTGLSGFIQPSSSTEQHPQFQRPLPT